jgi:phenylpropionate dioxygenase-like ring-hydroxylating dioxygenase large terminal subunit
MASDAESKVFDGIDLDDEWRGMQRRIVELIRGEVKSDLAEDLLELDPRIYTDPQRLEAERSRIFAVEPMLVALSGELAKPGDRVLFDGAGAPILVIRGEDGVLRAFLNMCTHRGTRLVANCDSSKRLVCPFHGWTFDLAGRLADMPMAHAFAGMDKRARGLVRVPLAEWSGMVFVVASPGDESLDIERFLGPIGPLLAALELGSLRCIRADRIEVHANWKLALDLGRENYHVATVHKDSLALNLVPQVTIFDCYGPHSRFAGAGLDFEKLVDTPEADWPEMKYQAVHHIFPNATLSFTHAFDRETPVVTLSRVFPGESTGEATTLISTYSRETAKDDPDAATHAADLQIGKMHESILAIVSSEDYGVAREVWRSIRYGAPGINFVLGRNELLVQRHHQEIAARIGMPLGSIGQTPT